MYVDCRADLNLVEAPKKNKGSKNVGKDQEKSLFAANLHLQ